MEKPPSDKTRSFFLPRLDLSKDTIHAIPPADKIKIIYPLAPTFFRWAEGRPVTTNQIYGHNLSDFPNVPHPERPKDFFDKVRPFSGLGLYPDMNDGTMLAGPQSRSKTVFREPPSRTFCPIGTYNRCDINKPFVMGLVKVTDRLDHSKPPSGFWLTYPVGVPRAPHRRAPAPGGRIESHLWTNRPDALVHNVRTPAPPPDMRYVHVPPRRDVRARVCDKFELP